MIIAKSNKKETWEIIKQAIEDGRQIIFFGRFRDVDESQIYVYKMKFQYDEDTDDYTIISMTFVKNGGRKIDIYSRDTLLDGSIINDLVYNNITRIYDILLKDLETLLKTSHHGYQDFINKFCTYDYLTNDYIEEFIYIDRSNHMEQNQGSKDQEDDSNIKNENILHEEVRTINSADPEDQLSSMHISQLRIVLTSLFEQRITKNHICTKIKVNIDTKDILGNNISAEMILSTEQIQGYLHAGGLSYLKHDNNENIVNGIYAPNYEFITDISDLIDIIGEIIYKTMRYIFKITSQSLKVTIVEYEGPPINQNLISFDENLKKLDCLKAPRGYIGDV